MVEMREWAKKKIVVALRSHVLDYTEPYENEWVFITHPAVWHKANLPLLLLVYF